MADTLFCRVPYAEKHGACCREAGTIPDEEQGFIALWQQGLGTAAIV